MLKVVAGVLVVAVMGVVIFLTQTTTRQGTTERLASSSADLNSRLILNTIYESSYIVRHPDKIDLAMAASYGCSYGDPDKGHRFNISRLFHTPPMERYLDKYISPASGNVYLVVKCKSGENIEIGEPPEGEENVVVTEMELPLARRGRTEVLLYRW